MKILYFIIALIVTAGIVYGCMYLTVRKYKITRPLGKSLILAWATTTFISSILIIQFSFSDFSPEPIQNSSRITNVQEAEERINKLESYTNHLEIDSDYASRQFFLLIGGLFVMQSALLMQIIISFSKSYEDKDTGV